MRAPTPLDKPTFPRYGTRRSSHEARTISNRQPVNHDRVTFLVDCEGFAVGPVPGGTSAPEIRSAVEMTVGAYSAAGQHLAAGGATEASMYKNVPVSGADIYNPGPALP
jgi:hypothetical protein